MNKKRKPSYKTFGENRSLRLGEFDYSSPFVYFLTLCSLRGEDVFTNSKLANEIIDCLKTCKKKLGYELYVYCLMPDHLHILISPRDTGTSISDFIKSFKSLTTRIYWKFSDKGKLWQRGFYDHIVRKEEDLVEITKYILNNPVRKGLVEVDQEYPYVARIDDLPL
jgi:REP element-mobilizing transposase RayT